MGYNFSLKIANLVANLADGKARNCYNQLITDETLLSVNRKLC